MRKLDFGLVGFIVLSAGFGVGLKALGAPPNFEALAPFVLSAGLVGGPIVGLLVGFGARFMYDLYLGWAGPWSLYTAPSYALVGLLAGIIGMRGKFGKAGQMAALGAAGALVYDVATMFAFGFLNHIPFGILVVGQVPFSAMHVLSSAALCFFMAPVLVRLLEELRNEDVIGVVLKV